MAGRVIFLLAAIVLFSVAETEGNTCSSQYLQCGSTEDCVSFSYLCDGVADCRDQTDENREFCEVWYPDRSCSRTQTKCGSGWSCNTWAHQCNSGCGREKSDIVCDALVDKKLPAINTDDSAMSAADLSSFASIVNSSIHFGASECPPFYSNVSGSCYAFLPFKLTWPESLEICETISGRLAELYDFGHFFHLVTHIKNKGLTSDFWIGGYYDITTEGWRWETGNVMALGTPFWTMTYQSKCAPRMISAELGPTESCYNYHQAPTDSSAGQCASLDFDNRFFINNRPCTSVKKPICLYQKK